MRSLAALLLLAAPLSAADPKQDYLEFVRKQAAELRAGDKPPATLEEAAKRNEELRKNLLAAWGGFPEKPCPLDPQLHGELKRDGYRVEKVIYESRPDHHVTANLYLPDGPGPFPGVLMPIGHSSNVTANNTSEYRKICRRVSSSPRTTGSIGTPAAS